MIITRIATLADKSYLDERYRHISQRMYERKFQTGEYMVIANDDALIGWLRWGYFWDNTPMMNMLHIEATHRNQGYGRQLVTAWENTMLADNYTMVMTSTLSNEPAQHFYRKLGYQDAGSLLLPDEPLEIIFVKSLDNGD
ncbi:MAG: GNAT family N-acetyltransferase [Chloroflexota bacterium]